MNGLLSSVKEYLTDTSSFNWKSTLKALSPDPVQLTKLKARKEYHRKAQHQLLSLQYPFSKEKIILSITSIKQLIEGYIIHQYTCREVIMVFAKQIMNEDTHYLSELFLDEALERALLLDQYLKQTGTLIGPLHGVPIAFSDEVMVKGVDTTLGCYCEMEFGDHDSILVESLKRSGAISFCKTNVPWHLLFNDVTNPVFGECVKKNVNLKRKISLDGRCGGLAMLVSQSNFFLMR
jgi:amidase